MPVEILLGEGRELDRRGAAGLCRRRPAAPLSLVELGHLLVDADGPLEGGDELVRLGLGLEEREAVLLERLLSWPELRGLPASRRRPARRRRSSARHRHRRSRRRRRR